ncbi:NADAR family protein [Loktanella sp. DJP18]|uniref:NADAR family protein n=1 Tax=Loktanella sp. DJP18 TaxID=3409788 RepID=UPI003BB72C5F
MNFEFKEQDRSALEAENAILGFDGPTRFLSNFADSTVVMYGISFPTVEHAFAAAKLDPNGGVHPREAVFAEMRVIAAASHPNAAKKLGRRKVWEGRPFMRPDWDTVKEDLILTLLRRKFEDPDLRRRLLDTGDVPLVELNTWGDDIWGMIEEDGILRGRNMLGEMLMHVRAEIRHQVANAD